VVDFEEVDVAPVARQPRPVFGGKNVEGLEDFDESGSHSLTHSLNNTQTAPLVPCPAPVEGNWASNLHQNKPKSSTLTSEKLPPIDSHLNEA